MTAAASLVASTSGACCTSSGSAVLRRPSSVRAPFRAGRAPQARRARPVAGAVRATMVGPDKAAPAINGAPVSAASKQAARQAALTRLSGKEIEERAMRLQIETHLKYPNGRPELAPKIEPELLDQAYERCGAVTADYAKTFYLGTQLMTPEKARAIWAIYVWCRRTDELVDGPNSSRITPEVRPSRSPPPPAAHTGPTLRLPTLRDRCIAPHILRSGVVLPACRDEPRSRCLTAPAQLCIWGVVSWINTAENLLGPRIVAARGMSRSSLPVGSLRSVRCTRAPIG